ncbi:hypothetical protein DFH11DRAFT_316692 [Phellopilus nigrolimitatus]|nr:hypothetical protein DFH11DRAFT_316692 [Phellopilus nigrolimitatus]
MPRSSPGLRSTSGASASCSTCSFVAKCPSTTRACPRSMRKSNAASSNGQTGSAQKCMLVVNPSGLELLALRLAGVCVRLCGGISLGRYKHEREWTSKPECAQAPADAALYRLHLDARASHARTAAAVTGGEGTGCRGSSMNEEGLLDGNGDGDFEEEDALLDGEEKPKAIWTSTRRSRAPQTGLSSLTKSQNQTPLKTVPLSYPALSAGQYHDMHTSGINALIDVATSARGETGKRIPLPSVATRDHAHAVSREYHASRGCGRASQMDELEERFDGDAVSPGPAGAGTSMPMARRMRTAGEGSGEGDADADAAIMDAMDAAMKMED